MRTTVALILLWALFTGRVEAQLPSSSYLVEDVETPADLTPEISALTFTDDGRLWVCFRRGSVWSYRPSNGEWKQFATGLFWPLGILPGKPGEFFVAQIPELTRIVDTDDDGRADLYETISDNWGLSGNYHEFVYGPVRDAEGNFYLALGSASGNASVEPPFRGRENPFTPRAKPMHHSPVEHRGWVIKVSPSGEVTPISSGLRQGNGLVFNTAGDLFVMDNQGDWVGTTPFHHVTAGAFHGHAPSLVWDPSFAGDPMETPVDTLEKRRKPAAVLIPQNDMAGSTAQPLLDTTGGKFGPFTGQFIVAEWTHPRLFRVTLEKVGSEYQGACYSFIEGRPLTRGNLRLAFSPEGDLYIGKVARIWGGRGDGLQRVRYTGKLPMDILDMRLLKDGFELRFTKPVDPGSAKSPSVYSLRHYHYGYSSRYGSPKIDVTPVAVLEVRLSEDQRTAVLRVEKLIEGRVYDLRPRGIVAADGERLVTRMAAYTVNRLRND